MNASYEQNTEDLKAIHKRECLNLAGLMVSAKRSPAVVIWPLGVESILFENSILELNRAGKAAAWSAAYSLHYVIPPNQTLRAP